MSLTERLGIVADCYPDPQGQPDMDRWRIADDELFGLIRASKKFVKGPPGLILDIGSGMEGSDLVNRYVREFPSVQAVYLDYFHEFLKKTRKPRKVRADAIQMPFHDRSFDIAYAGAIIAQGVLNKQEGHGVVDDNSYGIAKEGFRVLKKGGLFVFTYCLGDDIQTLANLSEIGFRRLDHLQRIGWMYGIPTDTYCAMK